MQNAVPKRRVVDSRGAWCLTTPLTDRFKAWREATVGDGFDDRSGHDARKVGTGAFVFIDLITAAQSD